MISSQFQLYMRDAREKVDDIYNYEGYKVAN